MNRIQSRRHANGVECASLPLRRFLDPCRIVAAVVAGFAMQGAAADSLAIQEKAALAARIDALVAKRDYATVLRDLERDTKTQARMADGLWRASIGYQSFEIALTSHVESPKAWDSTLRNLGLLATGNSNGWLLVAEAARARAWAARGSGYASSVAPEDLKTFRTYVSFARAVLEQHKAELARVPVWFSLRLALATDLGEGENQTRALFDEAVAKHPAYHAIYFARQRDLSPQWNGHGRRDGVLDLQTQVASMGGETAAEGVYVRLLWLADKSGYAVTHSPRIDANVLRDGALRIAQAFPDQWNLQSLYLMACERSDKITTRQLGLMVKQPLLPSVWETNLEIYESCKDWSEGRLKQFLIRDHDGDETKDFLIQ